MNINERIDKYLGEMAVVDKNNPLIKKLAAFAKKKGWKIIYGNKHKVHEQGFEDVISAYEDDHIRFYVFSEKGDDEVFFAEYDFSGGDENYSLSKKIVDSYIKRDKERDSYY